MHFRGKRYKKDANNAPKGQLALSEAVAKLEEWASAKFNQTVECVIQLGIDPRHADQTIRGAISFPHGIGKSLKVIAFCEQEHASQATDAGAMEVGADELVSKIQGGWLDFDVAIAHPRMMSKVGKFKVEFRNDSGGNVHVPVGKLDFEPQQLIENISAFIDRIKNMRPATTKGAYLKKICICATMSPSVEVAVS